MTFYILHVLTHNNCRFDYILGFILSSLEKTLLLVNLVTVPGSMFIVINFLELLHLITWVSIPSIWLHSKYMLLSSNEYNCNVKYATCSLSSLSKLLKHKKQELEVTHHMESLLILCFQIKFEFISVGFSGGRKIGEPGEKPSEQEYELTINSTPALSVMPGQGFKLRSYQGKTSPLSLFIYCFFIS